jgi:hypothetical protein
MHGMTVKIHVEPIIDEEQWCGVCDIIRVLLEDQDKMQYNHIEQKIKCQLQEEKG